LRLVKPALHQLVDIVALMRANGVIHKDLLFKNMMARKLSSNHNPPIRVTVMDFCWSSSDHDPEAFSNTNNRLGHFTRPGDW
jgi:tRNA A-37 threonylcarbamoyl transferase component Bud32